MKNKYLEPSRFHVATSKLMGIPPKESELAKEKDHREWLKEVGKSQITVCCPKTKFFIEGALNVGITDNELAILKEVLLKHPLDRFGRNKFRIKDEDRIDFDSLVDEVLEIASFFSNPHMKEFFISSFYSLVQTENSGRELELAKFNRVWSDKITTLNSSNEKTSANKKSGRSINISGGNNQIFQVNKGTIKDVKIKSNFQKPNEKKSFFERWWIELLLSIIVGIILILIEYGVIQNLFE